MSEHDDHIDFICSINADRIEGYAGDWVDGNGVHVPMTQDECDWFNHQEHALIYTDGYVAVTLFECCYAMWHLKDGLVAGGSLWKRGEWKLTEKSLQKIQEIVQK